jgi:hypothetical protein
MAQDPFSFDISLSGDSPATATDSMRYIAPPFDARMISDQEAFLLLSRQQQTIRLPLSAARILGACDRFGTIEELTRHVAERLRVPPEHTGNIAHEIRNLANQELLLSEEDLHRHLLESAPGNEPSEHLETLFIRTCNRPDTLSRLLDSLEALGEHSGLTRCVVLDDGTGEASEQTATVVADYRERLPLELHHVARHRRRQMVAAIAKASGADPDHLHWFIEGDSDDPAPGYGASLNLALLLGAGDTFAIMDDDASLEAYRLHTGNTHRFSPVPSVRLEFPEPERDLGEQFESLTTNPLAEHARYLGRSGAGFARLGENDRAALYERVDPQTLFDLHGPTRVRISSNGTLGDPGTSGIHWLFAEPAENLTQLCSSKQQYLDLVGQRRVARSPDSVQVSSAISLMTTTLTGIDNRELLLPTQARGGNEDLMFGTLTAWLHPGSLHARLPHMLLHMRPEPRRWDMQEIYQPRSTNRGRFLSSQISRLVPDLPSGNIDHRISLLAAWFNSLASSSTEELRWRLQQDLLDLRGDTIEQVSARLAELSPPNWLAEDFRRSLQAHARDHDADRTNLDKLALELPRFARQYATGLDCWVRAWGYCSAVDVADLLSKNDTLESS